MENKTQNVPTELVNRRIMESLDRNETEKVAQAGSDYTRIQVREDSFMFKILPPQKATDDMLDRDLDERIRIIEELEPDSPGAKWVPLQTLPDGEYITGSRYQVPFARLVTKSYKKDVDELRTYRQDLRKIFTDLSIKDGLAEIDSKGIETVNAIVDDVGSGDQQRLTGKVQRASFSGGVTVENIVEAKKLLPRGSQTMPGKFRLRNYLALCNDVTAQDILKLQEQEVGTSNKEQMFREGLTSDSYLGMKFIFTIKDNLVPDNVVYLFAAPEFLGKSYYLTDWTMFMKKEAFFVEWFSYWFGGFAIGNVAGVARVDLDA